MVIHVKYCISAGYKVQSMERSVKALLDFKIKDFSILIKNSDFHHSVVYCRFSIIKAILYYV